MTASLVASGQVDERGVSQGEFGNGGFEQGIQGWTWMISLGADATCVVDEDVSHGGQQSVRFSNNTPKKAHTYGVLRRRITGLKPNTPYRIIAWVKGEDAGEGMIGGGPNWDYVGKYPTGTYDWTMLISDVATRDTDNFELVITCADTTKAFWLDDVQFIERKDAKGVEITPPVVRTAEAFGHKQGGAWLMLNRDEVYNDEWVSGAFGLPGPIGSDDELQLVAQYGTDPSILLDTILISSAVPEEKSVRIGFSINSAVFREQGEWTLSVRRPEGGILAQATLAYVDLKLQVQDLVAELLPRRQALAQMMQSESGIARNPYVRIWFDIGNHYLTRLEKNQTGQPWWARLQARQIGRIYDQVDTWLQSEKPLEWPNVELAMRPIQSMRFTDTQLLALREGGEEEIPFFGTGYGHFDQVDRDVPLLARWGMDALAKDFGPEKGAMTSDRQLNPDDSRVKGRLKAIDTAAKYDVFVDVMLGSHGLPDWFEIEYPDAIINNPGFIDYDIDHPESRRLIRDWISIIMPYISARPNIISMGVSNEPQYIRSGRTPHSRDLWTEFLERRYGTIEQLNAIHGGTYASFMDVSLPPLDSKYSINVKRAAFDWLEFNSRHFADWHRWIADQIHQYDPEMPTYAKIVEMRWDSGALRSGIDPELICNATELAGCDAQAYPTSDAESPLDWHLQEMWYDLLHSFRGQPVVNTEFHMIPNGLQEEIPSKHVRAVLWQSGIHHVAFSTMWIWDKPIHRHFEGSIYLRPMALAETQRTMLDIRRLSPEMAALANAPKPVAILYSTPSLFWDDRHYGETAERIHKSMLLRGYVPTFVSENQLMEGQAARFDVIILPNSGHVRETTVRALGRYIDAGGRVMAFGCLPGHNEYDFPLEVPESVKVLDILPVPKEDQALGAFLVERLTAADITAPALTDLQSNAPAWGIEYRTVTQGETELVSIINLNHDSKSVSLAMRGAARNLINGETIDLARFELEPLEPVLLRIEP